MMLMKSSTRKLRHCLSFYSTNNSNCDGLESTVKSNLCCPPTIPIGIGNQDYRTKDKGITVTAPYNRHQDAYRYFNADTSLLKHAVETAMNGQEKWLEMDFDSRIEVMNKVSQLASEEFRQKLNASMICGSAYPQREAEIETNNLVNSLKKLCTDATLAKKKYEDLKGRKGFWACITPFNSPSVSASMISATLLLGNSVIWKPNLKSLFTNWVTFEMFRGAGLPPGVLNFVPTETSLFHKHILKSKELAGVNLIGKKQTYENINDEIQRNIAKKIYTSPPRVIAGYEGTNCMIIDPCSDIYSAVRDSIISAYSYSGQKFSSASILFCPHSRYCEIRDLLKMSIANITVNHPVCLEENTFMSAVIDGETFSRMKSYIDKAKSTPEETEVLAGGHYSDDVGYYVAPTLILCKKDDNHLLKNNVFGPILSLFIYEDSHICNLIDTLGKSNTICLSASIFSQNEEFVKYAVKGLSNSFYYVNVNRPTLLTEGEQFICEHPKSGGGDNFLLNFKR